MLPARMRSYLILDIETVRDRSLSWDEGFPPPPFHEVVALGVLWLDEDLTFRKLGTFGERAAEGGSYAPERKVLEDFCSFVGKRNPHIVTYNGRGFDLPVLVNRCLKHGVPFRAYYADRDYRYRYSELGHIDLADVLSDYGAARRASLDTMAQLVGMPGKMEVDGSMVETMFEQGRIEDIRTYCLHDVVQTAFVFLRVELLRGRLDVAQYRERARGLWDALAADPRAKPVIDASDRRRVLLEEDDQDSPKASADDPGGVRAEGAGGTRITTDEEGA